MLLRLHESLGCLAALLLSGLGSTNGTGDASTSPHLDHIRTLAGSTVSVYALTDADVLSDGSMVLLDGTANTITVVPTQGAAATFGRKGGGPGEIGLAKDLEVGPHDEIAVADVGNGRIDMWSGKGKWLGLRRVNGWAYMLSWTLKGLYVKVSVNDGLAIAVVDSGSAGNPRVGGLLPGVAIARLPPAAWAMTPSAVALSGNGLFARSDSIYSVLEMDAAGHEVREFRRAGIKAAKFSDAERSIVTERLRRGSVRSGHFLGEAPIYKGLISSLAVDLSGRVWVLRGYEEGRGSDLDVFTPQGTYLNTVHVDKNLRHIVIRNSLMIAVAVGVDDEATAEVYHIR